MAMRDPDVCFRAGEERRGGEVIAPIRFMRRCSSLLVSKADILDHSTDVSAKADMILVVFPSGHLAPDSADRTT
jgi:hypothetical protein